MMTNLRFYTFQDLLITPDWCCSLKQIDSIFFSSPHLYQIPAPTLAKLSFLGSIWKGLHYSLNKSTRPLIWQHDNILRFLLSTERWSHCRPWEMSELFSQSYLKKSSLPSSPGYQEMLPCYFRPLVGECCFIFVTVAVP